MTIRALIVALVVVAVGCGDDGGPRYSALTIQAAPNLPKGQHFALTVLGTLSSGGQEDVTPMIEIWESSAPTVAMVRVDGEITALGVGATTITAKLGTLETTLDLAVTDAELVTLALPALDPLASGLDRALIATGTYTDGTMLPVDQVTWSSSNEAVATISAAGVATAVAVGDTSITATSGDVSTSAHLRVTEAVLVSIAVTPADVTLLQGETQQLSATGTYSDDSTAVITGSVTWASSEADITVSSSGLATATSDAIATITATDPTTNVSATTMMTSLAGARITIAYAGGSIGDVRVHDTTSNTTLATCSAPCEVIAPIGDALELVATSPATFGGFDGDCATAQTTCSFTAVEGGADVTTTFALDPGHAWQRLLYPGETVFAADYDSAGHLFIGTTNHVTKLDLDGTTLMELALPARQLRIGPSDTIYVISGTNLVKLDAAGTTLWTRALGSVAPQPDDLQFIERLDVGANGVAAVSGDTHVATWAADGTPGWSASIPTAGNDWYGVGVDSAGNVWTAVDDQSSGERTWGQGFTAAGAAITTQLTPNNQYHGMLLVDNADHVSIASSGHGHVRLDRRSQADVSDFSIGFDVNSASYVANGIAIASNALLWVHENTMACCGVGFTARNVTAAGVVTATVTRTTNGDVGVRPYAVAGHSSGRRAIAGEFWGPSFSRIGWIQAYVP